MSVVKNLANFTIFLNPIELINRNLRISPTKFPSFCFWFSFVQISYKQNNPNFFPLFPKVPNITARSLSVSLAQNLTALSLCLSRQNLSQSQAPSSLLVFFIQILSLFSKIEILFIQSAPPKIPNTQISALTLAPRRQQIQSPLQNPQRRRSWPIGHQGPDLGHFWPRKVSFLNINGFGLKSSKKPKSKTPAKKPKDSVLEQKSPAEFFAENKNIAGFGNRDLECLTLDVLAREMSLY
ncbi:putative DNA topoisomerase (ATP-hydrolyzing) [Rosa chinensis]|uniref:Putative DNA topoisomerase (ATP-hydrolyzing) n=1 Tax=Rosa chinensis TaxID=74649 RepID=A0A2P6RBP1_ROSCH|nr:putative DNA topoisomerase (ATP-hydrolyzing) [Rosa chinensis]